MEKLKYERPVITKINAGMPDKFGMKSKHRIINKIDNVSVNDLLKEYGSPLFIISEKKIRDTYNEAYRAFSTRYPKVQFAWSYKTNYLDAVCKTFHKLGSWAEVVSGFEYEKALANNVNGGEIIFNGPSKSKEELIIELQELRQENNILKILGLQCFWNNCKSLMKYQNVERKREKPIFNR